MDKKKIPFLNSLRLLATLGVVLLHTSATWFDNNLYAAKDYYAFGLYNAINVWAVPVFVLISGALFLNPAKETGIKIIVSKYVRRIALALLLFGLPMCAAETILTKGNWGGVICNFLTGHSWNHMWYLYMLLGLYMLTPLVKLFVTHSSRRTILVVMAVLFVMSSVFPVMQRYGISLKGWMVLPNNPYILLYMLGFYLLYMERDVLKIWHIAIGILIAVGVIIYKLTIGIGYMLYYDPNSILLATSIFLLFKRLNLNWELANNLNPYCFGIYLVHTVFLNVMAKVLHVNPADWFNPWLSIPLLAMVTFILSYFTCYCMRKIPFMRKYVL